MISKDYIQSPRTPENGEFDYAYKSYRTPPTPFQESLQIKAESKSNPYAQSLWLTSRGYNLGEIEKYEAHSKVHVRSDSKPITSVLPNLSLKDLGHRPSRNSHKENYNDRDIISNNGNSKFMKPSPSSKYPNLPSKKCLKETPAIAPSFTRNEFSYHFVLMETKLAKIFRILNHISMRFELFVEENAILCHPSLFSNIFGSVKTLRIIHDTFLQKLLDGVNPSEELEDSVYDHLQRLAHVYPSYFQNVYTRNAFVDELTNEKERFVGFFAAVQRYIDDYGVNNGILSFKELVNAPITEIQNFLTCIDNFVADKSPRVGATVEKLLSQITYYDPSKAQEKIVEPIYLDLPLHWRNKYMSSHNHERLENQILKLFRNEFKIQYGEYIQAIEKIKSQVSQMATLSTTNIGIARGYLNSTSDFDKKHEISCSNKTGAPPTPKTKLFQENMMQSMHSMYVDKIDIQNKAIYQLLYNFDQMLNTKYVEMNEMCQLILFSSKSVLKDDSLDKRYKTEQLYSYFRFQNLLEAATLVIFEKYRTLYANYLRSICKTNVYDANLSVQDITLSYNESKTKFWAEIKKSKAILLEQSIKSQLAKKFFS